MALCVGCSAEMLAPFIKCGICSSVVLCLRCFAAGIETDSHSSDHSYEVIKDDFSLFNNTSWTVADEMCLLSAISECGIDNWDEISEQVCCKTAEECRKHYDQFYLQTTLCPLPETQAAELKQFVCPLTFKASVDPPRPADDSAQFVELSGYSCCRSDFTVEHNNFAELDIRDIVFMDSDTDLQRELQLAVMRIYCTILKERQRRKWVVRQFGLIDVSTHIAHSRRYEQIIGSKSMENFRRLSQLLLHRPVCYDLCLETVSLHTLLRQRITELQHYRQLGLRWLHSAKLYTDISTDHQLTRVHLMKDVLRYIHDSFQYQQSNKQKVVYNKLSKNIEMNSCHSVRRTAPPLDIVGLPGYDRLTENEKQLCSRVRLVPESYLEFRRLLVTEHAKHGYLRLAQARTLVKIDVNKTRKIYDFLISEGFINNGASRSTHN